MTLADIYDAFVAAFAAIDAPAPYRVEGVDAGPTPGPRTVEVRLLIPPEPTGEAVRGIPAPGIDPRRSTWGVRVWWPVHDRATYLAEADQVVNALADLRAHHADIRTVALEGADVDSDESGHAVAMVWTITVEYDAR